MIVIENKKPAHRSIGPWHQKLKAHIYVYKTVADIDYIEKQDYKMNEDRWDQSGPDSHMVTITNILKISR